MKVKQYQFQPEKGWSAQDDTSLPEADFIVAFGSGKDCDGDKLNEWKSKTYPDALLIGCSTAGEILNNSVDINTIAATAVKLDKSRVAMVSCEIEEGEDSEDVGKRLANQCDTEGLRLFFLLSDGMHVNGTRLVNGVTSVLPERVIVTGGLAGDGKRFERTQVAHGDVWGERKVAALCFYGDDLEIGFGSLGGWDPFGPDRLITRAEGNTLYELDDQSALTLYKHYLGEYAQDLPSSGLRFPLMITTPDGKKFVRTLLAVDDDTDSMTFAGDLPEGSYARLMKANFDRLIDGAIGAAEATQMQQKEPAELAFLISCVGRKIVLEQRVEEEIEGVRSILGDAPAMTGFYSYGEICPLAEEVGCTLHNQTMTITTLRER